MKQPSLRLLFLLPLAGLVLSMSACHRNKGCCPRYGSAMSGKCVVTESHSPMPVYYDTPMPMTEIRYQPATQVRYQAPPQMVQPVSGYPDKPSRYFGAPRLKQRLTNYSYLGVYPPHDYSQSRSNPFVWYDRSPAYDKPGQSYFSQNPPAWPNEYGMLPSQGVSMAPTYETIK